MAAADDWNGKTVGTRQRVPVGNGKARCYRQAT
jgi:hypothetical protein